VTDAISDKVQCFYQAPHVMIQRSWRPRHHFLAFHDGKDLISSICNDELIILLSNEKRCDLSAFSVEVLVCLPSIAANSQMRTVLAR
jgi:hypothetical protein